MSRLWKKAQNSIAFTVSLLMVIQTLLSPVQTAFALEYDDTTAQIATVADGTEQQDGTDTSQEGGQAAESSDASEATQGDTSASNDAASTDSSNAMANAASTDSSSANSNAASSENDIMLADEDGGTDTGSSSDDTYKQDADPVLIDATSGTITASITYDSEGAHEYDGSPIEADDTLYGKVNIVFNSEKRPTLSQPNVYYELPSTVSVKARSSATLYDSTGASAGTWEIADNKVYLRFSKEWLEAQGTEISARFSFEFTLSDQSKGDGDSQEFTFPGTSTTYTITTKDENVSGNKWAANNGAYNAEDGTYTWIIQVNAPASGATNLQIKDTLGSNLSFVEGSFTMCDQNGNATGEAAPSVSIDGQNATINLGDRAQGTYYVSYKTTIKASALEGLKDNTEVDNVENKASWTWGSKTPESSSEITANPTKVKYSMASKSASGTNDDITWTVKLNNGSIKADMGGYTFTDTLGDGHTFKDGTQYTVTDASGNTIASGNVDSNSSTLEFTLPSNAGKQQLTVTYHTTMTDTTSPNPVKNTVEVTPDDPTYPSGKADGTYNPTDDRTYVSKEFVSKNDTGSTANWLSKVYFSNMSSATDVSTVYWQDTISKNPYSNDFNPIVFSNVVLKTTDGTTLTEGTDYTFSQNASSCKVVFLKSATVAALVGKADVTITYTTAPQKTDAVPEGGSVFTNTSSVYVNNIKKGEDTATYTVDATNPSVIKPSVSTSWNANYDNGDGTKGAYVSNWKLVVNATGEWSQGVVDLAGQDLVVTDKLPDKMKYVSGSVKVNLTGNTGYTSSGYYNASVTAAEGTGTVSFIIPTSGVATDGHWVGRVEITYQTVVKASDLAAGETVTFTNSASAQSGTTSFPAGSGSTTIKNEVLTKKMGSGSDKAHVKYTINVNPNALDLDSKSDTLTLTDTMGATLSYTNGSLKVVDASGADVTSSCSLNVETVKTDGEENTVLTLTVPDSTKLTVTYECSPIGAIGQNVTVSNSCALSGMASSSTNTSNSVKVQKSEAGVEGVSYGLTVYKVAQEDTTKKLEGAEFTLYSVDLTSGKKSKVDTQVTDAKGTATFGTKDSPLESSKLYFVEETKAPAGYEISYEGTYVLFYPATATSQAVSDFEKAYAEAEALGITPVVGTVSDASTTGPGVSFSVYDKKSTKATATLHAHKTVKGTDTKKKFEFSLFEADENGAATGDAIETKTVSADETVDFSDLSFTAAGTYKYVISETSELGGGWSKSADVVATITVTEGDNGLEASVEYSNSTEDSDAAEITNTYATSGEATISVYKTVNGGTSAKPGEKFTFDFYEGEGTDGKKLDTVETEMDNVASFDNVKFTKAGTYTYTIHETGHNDNGWTAASDVTATVTVEDDGEGNLTATVEYSKTADGKDAAGFDDTYTATGQAVIEVAKTVNQGKLTPDQEFTFGLFATDKDGNKTGDAIATLTIKAGEAKSFDAIDYYFDDDGQTYTYVISETSELGEGWTRAADQKVTVTVSDNGDGTMNAAVSYADNTADAATFDNTYVGPTTVTFEATKMLEGSSMAANKFEFEVLDADGNQVSTAWNEKLETGKTSKVTFDPIKITAAGEYWYTIHEVAGDLDKIQYDSSTFKAKVVATQDADGNLSATVTYYDVDVDGNLTERTEAPSFVNTYNGDAVDATLTIHKAVKDTEGRDLTSQYANKFRFQLVQIDTDTDDGDAQHEVALETSRNDADGNVTFESLSFTQSSKGTSTGTYDYVIREVVPAKDAVAGVSYSTDICKVSIKVSVSPDEPYGLEVESITYSMTDAEGNVYVAPTTDDSQITFTNTVTPVEATLGVTKTVNGTDDIKDDESFDFALYATDENGDTTGDALSTATVNSANHTAVFAAQSYTEEGTYTYKVVETSKLTSGWTKASDQDVTVTVGNDGAGNLVVKSVVYGEKSTQITASDTGEYDLVMNNTYGTTAEATIKVQKNATVSDDAPEAVKNKTFDFELYDPEDYAVDDDGNVTTGTAIDTVTGVKIGETKSFKTMTFDEAGTHYYVLHEVNPGSGWTSDGDKFVKIEVTEDAATRALTATVYQLDAEQSVAADDNVFVEGDTATVTNTYAAEGDATISVYKTVNGGTEAKADETFTFDLYEGEGTDGTKLGTVETKAGEVTSFDDVKFTDAGTYTYTIHETGHNTDGWTAASDVTATVTVTDNGDGTLKAEVEYSNKADGKDAAGFDDTYTATGEAIVSVHKTVVGADKASDEVKDKTFTFQLLDENKNVLDTVEVKAGETKSFKAVEYDFDDAGKQFVYYVHEDETDGNGWTKSYEYVTAVVDVKDNGDGTLTTTPVGYSRPTDDKLAAEFVNTYSTSGEATISVYKTVNGGTEAKADEEFTFDLYSTDDYAVDSKGNVQGEKLDTVTTKAGNVASFENIKFTEAGTYNYIIHETGHNSDGWTAASDVIATVTVTDNGDGTLSAEVRYTTKALGEDAAGFNNLYAAEGTATISVNKVVNGGTEAVKNETFDFDLYEAEGYKNEDGEVTGTKLDSATAKAGETVSFKNIAYDFDDAGKTYTYVIHEVGHNDKGWTADSDTTATVKVEDAGDGTLTTTVTYARANDDGSAAKFTNTYAASGEATISVYKTVNGGTTAKTGEEFTFDLYEGKGTSGKKLGTVKTTAGNKASFDNVKFTEAGTYTYTIHEVGHDGNGWMAASDVTATVTVKDDGTGSLTTSVKYSNTKEGAAGFDNTYTATGSATLSVNKVTEGTEDASDTAKNKSFKFQLLDADGKELDSVSVKAGETKSFSAIKYSFADAGKTFTYTIHENETNGSGWTLDSDTTATVTVIDKGDGTLSITVEYKRATDDGSAAKFTNKYAASGEAYISVYKTVNGGTEAKADETFTFDLYEAKGYSVAEDGTVSGTKLDTVETKAGNKASFDKLSYTKAGTYEYVIHETGHNDKGWEAAADVKATVTVTDNGNGKLTAEVAYSNTNQEAAGFDNTYKAEGTATISVNKVVNGGTEAAEGETFVFTLIDEDGVEVDTVSAKAGETVSFTDIAYDFDDAGKIFTYTIHEEGHNEDGWFAADDVTATVKVEDAGDGTLTANVAYSNGVNAAAFDNTLSTTTGKIQIKKTVNGGPAQTDEHFTFELQPQDDAPAAEKSEADTFGGDTCDFGNIEFTKPGTYTYVIHETSELGDGWTNDADLTVTVTVVRDEENKCLKVESIDYGDRSYEADGVVMAHFDNTYSETPEVPEEEQPKKTEKKSTKAALPQTGDSTPIVIIACAVTGLIVACAGFEFDRHRDDSETDEKCA